MFWWFFMLLMLNDVVGVLAWLMIRRVLAYMRDNPEAARLFAENVITPILTGGKKEPEEEEKPPPQKEDEEKPVPKKTKGTLV